MPLLARWLDVGGPPQKADAVVLLNGASNTPAFRRGGPRAWRLGAEDPLEHGGRPSQPGQRRGPAFVRDQLEGPGLRRRAAGSRRRAWIPTAKTTFDEAKAVADYLADHPAKRLMIVTEGPHTRRARWIFQRVLADRPVEIVMVSAPADEFDNENWWRSEAGFLFVVSEYFKLFYYGLRYGWLGYEIVGGVAVMIFLRAWFSRRRKLLRSGVA